MRRLLPTAAAAVIAALAVGACGSGSKSHSTTTKNAAATVSGTTSGTTTTGTTTISAAAAARSQAATQANLKSRPSGSLIVDGFSEGSLTQYAYQDYKNANGSDAVSIENDPAPTAFQNLCTGSVDIVDSSSPISKAEMVKCHEDGITPVQIQVGSDAVVLATENETDVGADCLTSPQVTTIFKAGSPVANWDQLGFDDVALRTAGPNPANSNFAFFGSSLVGSATPTLDDFRFDYKAYASEDGIRGFVIGTQKSGELASTKVPAVRNEIATVDAYIAGQRATARGARAALKSARQQNDAAGIVTATNHLDDADAQLRILTAKLKVFERQVGHYLAIQRRAESVLGRLGVFQYSYYTLYEEQLRPLEITSKVNPENCVFPSQATITNGDYPLSRQLLLTASLQSLRKNPGLRAFLLSYLKNANTLTSNQVLVPLPNNILTQEEDWLEGKQVIPTTSSATANNGVQNSMSNSTPSGSTQASGETTTPTSNASSQTQGGVPQGVH